MELLQRELHAVKEFRKQKAQLMEEIKDMRNELEEQRTLKGKVGSWRAPLSRYFSSSQNLIG